MRAAGFELAERRIVADGFGLRLPRDTPVLRELIEITGARLVVLDSFRRLAPDAKEDNPTT